MNTATNHVIDPEMLKLMRDAGVDGGYAPVPAHLQAEARRLLADRQEAYATRDNAPGLTGYAERKRKLKNKAKRMRKAGVMGY